jgi:hypothetical protein
MPARATIWFVNATRSFSALPIICQQAQRAGQIVHVLHRSRDRETILQSVPPGNEFIRLIELGDGGFDFAGLGVESDAEIIFLPCVEKIDWTDLQQRASLDYPHCIQPLVATPPSVNPLHYRTSPVSWFGWRAGGELARRILREPSAWEANGLELVEFIQHWPDPPRWQSIPLRVPGSENYPLSSSPRLTMSSSVLVVISFYGCEEWLHACLTSVNQQTRPPENIVVVDDCSPALPRKYLEPFPNVTLLSTTRNVGPEKILNNIIFATDYEAYMVQDADDWSSHDRLELSLRGAEQTGADMVGTHEFRVHLPKQALELCVYPPDVNHAMSQRICHHLLHGASFISRALAVKIGGLDEQLKLCADIDFCARAWHAGRIINLSSFCFFRRVRVGSLTRHVKTGYQSATRIIEDKVTSIRGSRNLELARAGRTPNVVVQQKEPIGFLYHQGPRLRLSAGRLNGERAALTAISGM